MLKSLFYHRVKYKKITWRNLHRVDLVNNLAKRVKIQNTYLRNFLLKRRLTFPKIVQVESTNACNLECIMCPHKDMTRKIGNMDFELFKIIVDQCSNGRIEVLVLNKDGEPLLHPRISRMVAYAKAKDIPWVSMDSNAYFLTADMAVALIKAKLDEINITVDGVTKRTYEKIRVNSNFEKVVENIIGLVNLKKRLNSRNPIVTVKILKMRETISEIQSFLKYWKPIVDRVCVEPVNAWAGQVEYLGVDSLTEVRRYPCPQLWELLPINWNGDAVMCCVDINGVQKLGNIKQQSIKSIWRGKKLEKIRRMHLKGDFSNIPLCSSCTYWYFCNKPFYWW